MNSKVTGVFLALGALSALGCDNNRSGNIRATAFGDLSHVLGERTPAFADLRTACDMTVPAGGLDSPLRRRPYLQQLTAHSVRVVWTTDAVTDAAVLDDSAVIVTSSSSGAVVATEVATRDLSARPRHAIQWSAAVSGLEPDTIYCYQVQAGGTVVRRAAFRTAPAPGTDRPVRFVAIGDSGNGSADQQAVFSHLKTVPADFMVHLGDIGYDSGSRANLEDYFFSVYADMLENFAVFPASGNHEYGTENAAPFREAFVLPENGHPDGIERWYSYDWGDAHFVVLDSERIGPAQSAWLDADLKANELPWTIVYLHRPPFSSGDHGGDGDVRRHFVPLFVKHRVHLVLSGHDHNYERTRSIDGVTYVVSGGGGRGTRDVGRSTFTGFSLAVCHFLYVTIGGGVLTGHAIDGVGQEFDSFTLTTDSRPSVRGQLLED